jgi:hypothetical protein
MSNTLQPDPPHPESIGLAELIEKVKDELRTPPATDPIFLVDKVELEVHVAVEKKIKEETKGSLGGKAELKLTVLNWDFLNFGKGEVEVKGEGLTSRESNRQDIHTIKVTLTPLHKDSELMSQLSEEKKKGVVKRDVERLYRGDQGSRELD